MSEKKNKDRSKEYEQKLSIEGTLDDVLKTSGSKKEKERKIKQ